MTRVFKYIFVTLLVIVVQTTMVQFLALQGITPDLIVIWIVYLTLCEGQLAGSIWGFGIGLFIDLVSSSFLGLSALTKTICGFVAGYFYNENKTQMILSTYRFLVVVLVAAFVHNTIYFVVFTRGTDVSVLRAVAQFGLTSTLYTATMGLLPLFGFARKQMLSR
jgi:rod shape-determining protein MreD